MITPSALPPLTALLAVRERHRCEGINDWIVVPHLGRQNLERLLALTREYANALLTEGDARDELQTLRAGREYLESLLPNALNKPLLPRLRNEIFRAGQAVRVYMGDTEGVTAPSWVRATVTDVRKGYRADWDDGLPNGGWHWRVTAVTEVPVFTAAPQREIAFSTSEPRAVSETEWDYLQNADDTVFFTAFCANASRPLVPLWCLERGLLLASGPMNMASFLSNESI